MKLPAAAIIALLAVYGCFLDPADMILVQGGAFQMGNAYEGGEENERPVHEVALSSFYIGKHEVTVGEFREFVDDTGYETTAERDGGALVYVGRKAEKRGDANWINPYYEQSDMHPVVCMSWYDAVEYCNWRSLSEGLRPCYSGEGDSMICDFDASGYRLPTEAEWEYAARSRGKRKKFAWGDGEPYVNGLPAGNTRDMAACGEWKLTDYWEGYDDGYAYTSPAGSFAPNELGVCDISGNVYEWCWDWYGDEYYAESPAENPTGPLSGEMRACRDAGFVCPIEEESVASRGLGEPSLTFSWGGFRLARSVR